MFIKKIISLKKAQEIDFNLNISILILNYRA
jgi:hypothetical protein